MANNNSIGTVPFSGTSRTPLPRPESGGLATLGKKVNKIARGVLGPATGSVEGLAALVNPNDIYRGLVESGENLKQGSLEADPLKLLLGAIGTATVAAENTPIGKVVKTPIKWYRGSSNPDELKGIFKAEKEGVLGGGGIYVTPDKTYAEVYSKEGVSGERKKGGFVNELDVKMTNPLIIDTVSKGKLPEIVVLEALGIKTDKAIDIVEKALEDKGGLTNQVKSKAMKQGYDGIILKKDGAIQEALVYNTKSIKNKNLKEGGSVVERNPYNYTAKAI
jgi:hypothetical protein